ncbi:hypothetical protein BCF33_0543 [Hasllibacter halocynthiae]|uniref:Uncharacterized protein n=1 Tax=Hasllibacter halocynthiae TaxID=595589 RepID=A0A2T0X7L8_9RHOB|nr:hypothetical protein [Hasllibacter halocynthiae]PRY94938.1 hypothetical protein BCF33_0543 [Hasllibacter halocynthiae]
MDGLKMLGTVVSGAGAAATLDGMLAPGARRRDAMRALAARIQERAWDCAAEGQLRETDEMVRLAAGLERRADAADPVMLKACRANRDAPPKMRLLKG